MSSLESDDEEVKEGKRIKKINSKQTINKTFNIISIKKSWKQFLQIKTSNKSNTVSFLSA